jgi:hypothetical protein
MLSKGYSSKPVMFLDKSKYSKEEYRMFQKHRTAPLNHDVEISNWDVSKCSIKILHEEHDLLCLQLNGFDVHMLHALRTAISAIPNMAITDAKIYKNDTVHLYSVIEEIVKSVALDLNPDDYDEIDDHLHVNEEVLNYKHVDRVSDPWNKKSELSKIQAIDSTFHTSFNEELRLKKSNPKYMTQPIANIVFKHSGIHPSLSNTIWNLKVFPHIKGNSSHFKLVPTEFTERVHKQEEYNDLKSEMDTICISKDNEEWEKWEKSFDSQVVFYRKHEGPTNYVLLRPPDRMIKTRLEQKIQSSVNDPPTIRVFCKAIKSSAMYNPNSKHFEHASACWFHYIMNWFRVEPSEEKSFDPLANSVEVKDIEEFKPLEIAKRCEKRVFKMQKDQLIVEKPQNCNHCGRCTVYDPSKSLAFRPDISDEVGGCASYFWIESKGVNTAAWIFIRALILIVEKTYDQACNFFNDPEPIYNPDLKVPVTLPNFNHIGGVKIGQIAHSRLRQFQQTHIENDERWKFVYNNRKTMYLCR